MRQRPATIVRQRGMSIAELLIGTAIGLFLVAGAAKLFGDHVVNNRRLILQARVNQDLRAAADLVARDLRRAGYWQTASSGATWPAQSNPYRAVTPIGAASASTATFSYSRNTENNIRDASDEAGFQLSSGVLRMRSGSTAWQELTDAATLTVTEFSVTPVITAVSLGHYCTPTCNAGAPGCPVVNVRRYDIVIKGRSVSDASVIRQLNESVRVRNDEVPAPSCP